MAVLSLEDAKDHLNITKSDDDAELRMISASAEAALTSACGPLEATAKTERVRGARVALTLLVTPVVSLTSVTALDGTALTVGDLFVSPDAGRVSRTDGQAFTSAFYDVVYSCGRAECPSDLVLAIKELVRHMWSTQRGGSQRPGSQPSDALSNSLPGSAYTFPFRVQQLIAPHLQVKG